MPAVSVIVPVYNTEKYLEECIRSLTEQTLSSLELIFVDDGSTAYVRGHVHQGRFRRTGSGGM